MNTPQIDFLRSEIFGLEGLAGTDDEVPQYLAISFGQIWLEIAGYYFGFLQAELPGWKTDWVAAAKHLFLTDMMGEDSVISKSTDVPLPYYAMILRWFTGNLPVYCSAMLSENEVEGNRITRAYEVHAWLEANEDDILELAEDMFLARCPTRMHREVTYRVQEYLDELSSDVG